MATRKTAAPTPAEPAPFQGTHGIVRLINRVRVEIVDALDRELARYDITAPQLIVLASVANKEADSAAAICKSISYDPGAMTLELTVAGKALYPQLLSAKETVQAQFLRGFSVEEARQLERLLDRMLDNR